MYVLTGTAIISCVPIITTTLTHRHITRSIYTLQTAIYICQEKKDGICTVYYVQLSASYIPQMRSSSVRSMRLVPLRVEGELHVPVSDPVNSGESITSGSHRRPQSQLRGLEVRSLVQRPHYIPNSSTRRKM